MLPALQKLPFHPEVNSVGLKSIRTFWFLISIVPLSSQLSQSTNTPNIIFQQGLANKIMYTFLFPMRATCPECIILNLPAVKSASSCDQGKILPYFYLVMYVQCFENMIGLFFFSVQLLSGLRTVKILMSVTVCFEYIL